MSPYRYPHRESMWVLAAVLVWHSLCVYADIICSGADGYTITQQLGY